MELRGQEAQSTQEKKPVAARWQEVIQSLNLDRLTPLAHDECDIDQPPQHETLITAVAVHVIYEQRHHRSRIEHTDCRQVDVARGHVDR